MLLDLLEHKLRIHDPLGILLLPPAEKTAGKLSSPRKDLWVNLQETLGNFDKLGAQSIADGAFVRGLFAHGIPAYRADIIIHFLILSQAG